MDLVNFINLMKTCLKFWFIGGIILAIGLISLGAGKFFKNKVIMYIGLILMTIAVSIFLIIGISIT